MGDLPDFDVKRSLSALEQGDFDVCQRRGLAGHRRSVFAETALGLNTAAHPSCSGGDSRRFSAHHVMATKITSAIVTEADVTDPRFQRTIFVTKQAIGARLVGHNKQDNDDSCAIWSTAMMKILVRTVAGVFTAITLVVVAGAIGAAQAHHSTAHSIGTKPNSSNR